MRRKILIACGIAAAAALLAAGTLASVTYTAEGTGTITAASMQVKAFTRDGDGNELGFVEIVPGIVVDDVLTVQSTNAAEARPMYVRVKLTASVSDGESGEAELAEGEYSEDTYSYDCMSMEIETDWTYDGGWFYYDHELEPGAETAPLFRKIAFDGAEMDNDYIGKKFVLHTAVDAVQSGHNGTSARNADGWPTA